MRRVRGSLLSLTLLAIFAMALGLPHHALAAIHLAQSNTTSLTNGLVGYWTFDGAVTDWNTNTTRDVSGNGNTGSLISMSTTSSPVPGKIGQALKFDGTNAVDTKQLVSTYCSAATCTIAVWAYPTGSSPSTGAAYTGQWVIGDDNGYIGITRGIIGGNDNIWFYNWDGNENRVGVPYSTNQWVHLVFVHGGGVLYAYKNGQLVGSVASGDTEFVGGTIRVGLVCGCGASFVGLVDDARIYNRALSATEVKQLYTLGAANVAHSNAIISNGLVGYWTFDGKDTNWSTGKAKDVSGQGNDGSLISMSTSTSPAIGKIGQALNFVRASSHFIRPDNNIQLQPLSFSVWVNAADIPSGTLDECNNYYPAIASDETGGFGWNLTTDYIVPTKFSLARWSDGGATLEGVRSNTTYTPNKWYHVVGVYTPTQTSLYINGAHDNSSAASFTTIWYSDITSAIGKEGCGAAFQYFNGKIDDVRIYNRALSATEIKQLYTLGAVKVAHSNAIISDGLVGYWTFDGPSIDWHTNTVADMSGTGNTGYITASVLGTTTAPVAGKIGQAFSFSWHFPPSNA
jgi:Concanavalin A-like lectin/glucanases superfamily